MILTHIALGLTGFAVRVTYSLWYNNQYLFIVIIH